MLMVRNSSCLIARASVRAKRAHMDGALCVVRCVRTIASDVFLERRLNMWMNLSEEGAPASVEHQSVNLVCNFLF